MIACGPADLETAGIDTESNNNQETQVPTEFGVIADSDCSQSGAGDYACNIVLYDQNKVPWQLYEHKDKVVVLDFSTSWCPPCQQAGHFVQPIQDEYGDSLVFVTLLVDGYTAGVSPTDDEMSDWVGSHSITTAPVLYASRDLIFDPTGSGIEGYVVGGFPTYIYIGRDGIIANGHAGFSEDYVRSIIEGLL
ncbi:MAG: TlpA family protein disulfide reductase [Candidatus Hodarchaeales archaeon]